MKKVWILIPILILLTGAIFIIASSKGPVELQKTPANHVYASWETMEYDKCVAIWLIQRFVDKDAEIVLYPRETEIQEGVVFDVPGAAWSRKHQKSTSDCIFESMQVYDKAAEDIVRIAHNVELNFWQLGAFPEAEKSFQEVMAMLEGVDAPTERMIITTAYFDELYALLKRKK